MAAGPLPVAEALGYAIALAEALREFHGRGRIYAFLQPTGVAILDGQVRLVSCGPSALSPYFSPEQVAGHDLDPRTDIFSLGAVMYEMLSGRRRSINAATRKGISVLRTREAVEVEEFLRLIHRTGERNRFDPHPDEYYRTVCTTLFGLGAASLYLAKVEGVSVAGVIAFESASTGYYAHAADDPERSRQIVAAAPLAWQIVRDCRAEGRTAFDFWGVIPDDSADHPWAGFSRFKKTFGGRMITRPGTFDLPLRPLRYRAYQAAREMRAARRAGRRPIGS